MRQCILRMYANTYVGKHEIVVLPVWEAPDEKLDATKERAELGISEKHELDISLGNIPWECFEISNYPGHKLLLASIESRLLLKTSINKPISKLNAPRFETFEREKRNTDESRWTRKRRNRKGTRGTGLKTVHLLSVNENVVCTVHFYVLSTPRRRDQRTRVSRSMREVENVSSTIP